MSQFPYLRFQYKSSVQWGNQWLALVELDSLGSSLGNTLWGELEVLEKVVCLTGSTESVQTELLVGVVRPAERRHDFNGHDWDTIWQDGQSVVLWLLVEGQEVSHGDNVGLDALLSQLLGTVNTERNLRTGRDKDDVWLLVWTVHSVTTLDGLLDGRTLQVRQVLSGQSDDVWGLLRLDGRLVSSGNFVTVSWSPDRHVWSGSEVSQSLNRSMGRTVLTQTNGVVGGNPDDWQLGQCGQSDGTGSVRNEVQESTTVILKVGTETGNTVHDGTHTVLSDTVSDVTTSVVTQLGAWWSEVNHVWGSGQVRTSQVSRTTNELRNLWQDLGQDHLGQLSGSQGLVVLGVSWQSLVPVLWQLTGESSGQDSTLLRVLRLVSLDALLPLSLDLGVLLSQFAVVGVDLVRNNEGLLWVEAQLLLQLLDVIWLQWSTVDTVGTLLQRTVTDDGGQSDQGWLVHGLGLLDGLSNGWQVGVTVRDLNGVPSVSLVTLDNVLGEGTVGGTVNRDLVVVPEGNQVVQLQVTGQRRGLRRDTLHKTTVTQEGVDVGVRDGDVVLVVGGSELLLGNCQTDSVGDTLTQWAGGDLDTWDTVVVLWVTRALRVELSERLQVVDRQVETVQVQHGVQEGTSVTVGQDESVSVDPVRVLWVELHFLPDGVGSWGQTKRSTRVTGVGLGDGVDSQQTDGGDSQLIDTRHIGVGC